MTSAIFDLCKLVAEICYLGNQAKFVVEPENRTKVHRIENF